MEIEQEESLDITVFCNECNKEMIYTPELKGKILVIDARCIHCMKSVTVKVKE